MNRIMWCMLPVAWIVLLLIPGPLAAASPGKGVLLLTSYHQGDPWDDHVVAGFLSSLPADRATVYIEHLDTRRFPGQEVQEALSALLAHKYAEVPISVLVAADDAALDFLLARGHDLFPARPIVFCGVNDFTPSRLAGRTDVTGVCEAPDILGTLELALTLLPRVDTIVALGARRDGTARANLERFHRAMRTLGRRAKSLEILDTSLDTARKALAALPRDSVVLRLSPLLADTGQELPLGPDMPALAAASPVPVLVLWDFDCDSGALGGRVVSGTAQGRAAAGLALRVLAGEPPAAIPVTDAPNQAVVDYRALTRFGISTRLLPEGTQVNHTPASAYERHKPFFWSAVVALAVLLPATLVLGLVLAGRQAAETRLRESEQRYRELVECANSLILRFDNTGRLVFVNEYAERVLGYGLADMPDGLETLRPLGPANLAGLLTRAMVAPQAQEDSAVESEVQSRDGRRLVLRWDSRPLRDADGNGTGWLAVGTEVTARRRAEEALAARMLAEEALLAFCRELLADTPEALDRALPHLLRAFEVGLVTLYENIEDPRLGTCCRPVIEVAAPGQAGPDSVPLDNTPVPYSLGAFLWANALEAGETVTGLTEEFPEHLQNVLRAKHILSVLGAPVTVDGAWSGFVVISETRSQRHFSRQDRTQLATAAGMISAHLSRSGQG